MENIRLGVTIGYWVVMGAIALGLVYAITILADKLIIKRGEF